jgi:putative exporter of polyketide antibiotics
MAGAAFLTGAIVAGALSRLPLPWRRLRLARWVLGAAIVYALAEAGHLATLAPNQSAPGHAAASIAALAAAALVAQFGAYFSVKR